MIIQAHNSKIRILLYFIFLIVCVCVHRVHFLECTSFPFSTLLIHTFCVFLLFFLSSLFGSGPWHSLFGSDTSNWAEWVCSHCVSSIVFGAISIVLTLMLRTMMICLQYRNMFFSDSSNAMMLRWTPDEQTCSSSSSSSKYYVPFAEWMKANSCCILRSTKKEWMRCVRLFEWNKLQKGWEHDKTEMVLERNGNLYRAKVTVI